MHSKSTVFDFIEPSYGTGAVSLEIYILGGVSRFGLGGGGGGGGNRHF